MSTLPLVSYSDTSLVDLLCLVRDLKFRQAKLVLNSTSANPLILVLSFIDSVFIRIRALETSITMNKKINLNLQSRC